MTPLDFAAERDAASTSWERGDPGEAQIMRCGEGAYNVLLPDASGGTHRVELRVNEHGAWVGSCDCEWYTS